MSFVNAKYNAGYLILYVSESLFGISEKLFTGNLHDVSINFVDEAVEVAQAVEQRYSVRASWVQILELFFASH